MSDPTMHFQIIDSHQKIDARMKVPAAAGRFRSGGPSDRPPRVSDARRSAPTETSKRVFDVAMTCAILVFISPVLLAVLVLVALPNDGPVFYAQRRIGRDGQVFRCFKFRTMRKDADRLLAGLLAQDSHLNAEWVTTGKLRNDPRVSRAGRFLRATSLDELPQLWNVLHGDMSLVGPRPITLAELEGPYTVHRGRDAYLQMRPGITGLWQISGRSTVSYESRVSMDVSYVQTFSTRQDITILLKTVGVVLSRKGAC